MGAKRKKQKRKKEPPGETASGKDAAPVCEREAANELHERLWAVISRKRCFATYLTYAEASERIRELGSEGNDGLCIVTSAAAARLDGPDEEKKEGEC